MDFKNRLIGRSSYPGDAFFFVYDYWKYDEGKETYISLSDGSVMPEELLLRLAQD